MSELKDGCPIFCMDSGAGWHCVCVCVCFKSPRQIGVKDVPTAQPCNSSRHRPFLSHLAISLCIAMICHVISFDVAEAECLLYTPRVSIGIHWPGFRAVIH